LKVWRGPTANQPLSSTVIDPHLAGGFMFQIYTDLIAKEINCKVLEIILEHIIQIQTGND
jgi:hypothetical protein